MTSFRGNYVIHDRSSYSIGSSVLAILTESFTFTTCAGTFKLIPFVTTALSVTVAEDGRCQESNELRYIANGVTGSDSANPHLLYEVGMNIVQKMEGSNAFDFSFKKKDQS